MPFTTDALSPALIRKIWFTVDTTLGAHLLQSSDRELAQCLAERLERSDYLTPEESFEVKRYVCSRANLIRDMVRQA